MKNILFLILLSFIVAACTSSYPIKGKTAAGIAVIRSPRSVDSAWAGVISFFIRNKILVDVMDKDKWLIITEKYDFEHRYSFVLHGKPIDTTAWIALSYVRLRGGFGNNPINVTSKWQVTIKPDGAGSIINITLSHVEATVHIPEKRTFHPDQVYTFTGVSTGVFEQMLGYALK